MDPREFTMSWHPTIERNEEDEDHALAALVRQFAELHEEEECECGLCRALRVAVNRLPEVRQVFGI